MAAGTLKSTQTNALTRVYIIGKAQYTMKTDLLFKKQGEVLLKRLKKSCILSSTASVLTCYGIFNLLFDVALGKEKLNF